MHLRHIATWDNLLDEKGVQVYLLRVKCPYELRKEAALWAEGQLSEGWRPNLERWGKHPDENANFWSCSELVWAAYYNQGIDIDNDDLPSMSEEEVKANAVWPRDILNDNDIEVIYNSMDEEKVRKNIDFIAHSPVDLIVTDPDGFIISKDSIKIPEAFYLEYDFDEDGYPDDFIGITARKIGNYLITVIPEPDANITDTYTLEVSTEYTTRVLAENVSICDIPTEPYVFEVIIYFDTGASANQYPSISGTHNGTIKPNQPITVNKLYTYPCPGTSGHTESIVLYDKNNTLIANGTWNGYIDDWQNITIQNVTGASYVTLLENHEYNYVIITGSYPQIYHTANLSTPAGFITCSEFRDTNGKRYADWIPAIRLE